MEQNKLKTWNDFLKEEDGLGTVEIILIIVVLISLVLIFKEKLTTLVKTIFDKITREATNI
ncbi:MAG: Flp1 family type IVb pilin [Lachnospiraceae bacterium]